MPRLMPKLHALFRFFENLTAPFPKADRETPPNTLFAFIRYYSRGFWKLIFLAK